MNNNIQGTIKHYVIMNYICNQRYKNLNSSSDDYSVTVVLESSAKPSLGFQFNSQSLVWLKIQEPLLPTRVVSTHCNQDNRKL